VFATTTPTTSKYTGRPVQWIAISGGTYLIGIVNLQKGWQTGGKEELKDLVCCRWLVLCSEIG
jgi:hypothetical protein